MTVSPTIHSIIKNQITNVEFNSNIFPIILYNQTIGLAPLTVQIIIWFTNINRP